MSKKKSTRNQATFSGFTTIEGDFVQVAGDYNAASNTPATRASYEVTPRWRSPITLAVLSWISVILAFSSVIPIVKFIFICIAHALTSNAVFPCVWSFLIIWLIITPLILLRKIAKDQLRYPLIWNHAISGLDHRLTIEQIKISDCPICGGRMRYRFKPTENTKSSDGSYKVLKREPMLECRRNSTHCYLVDPAIDIKKNND